MMFKWHKNIQNRQNIQSIISRKNFGILLILFLTLNMLFYSNNIFGLNLGGFLTNTGDVQALKDAATSSNRTVGEYDLRYGNIEVSEESGYEFKVSFKDSSNVSQVEYFTTNQAITIYQSNGESSTTSYAVNLNTDRVDVILGKTGSPINTTSSISCNGVSGSENSIKLILADGVTNTVKGSSSSAAIDIKNGTDLTILTEQQLADPQHSGNYEGMGTIIATGSTYGAGIGGGKLNGQTIGDITIVGGTVTATNIRGGAGIGCGRASDQSIGSITINGGTVTATGTYRGGAGIGGGFGSNQTIGDITITGGTVTATATGGSNGAGIGIGGGEDGSNQTIGDITINGGTVTATGYGGAGIGGGHASVSNTININVSGAAKVLAVGSDSGIGKGYGSGTYTVGIADTASVLAIVKSTSYQPIRDAELSGTAPAMIGGYLRTASNYINSGDTINIMEENGSICDTFNIPTGITDVSRMSFTTGGSTGTKYIQAVRNGTQMLASKSASVSTLEDFQYNSVRTITPNINELYLNSDTTNMNELDLTSIISAPTVNSGDTVLSLGNTATLTEGQINGLWEKTANSVTTWNESGGLFSNNHNLGTGNSVTITSLGVEGSTEITTTVSKVRLIGTSLVYQVTSPALTLTVENHVETVEDLGEYDLRYGNIEVMPEEGYAFKVNFRDEDGDKVEYFTSSKPITIYQSNGATTSTTNTITIGTTTNAVGNSTTPLSLTLGKTEMPVNIVATSNATKPCIGVIGNSNLKLILPDNIINTLDNSYGEGKTLSSSGDGTQVPCSAIQVAQVGSNRATLEIITAEGGSGNGKLIAKAGWDSAAIGGYKSGSSGYGGGNITITSGNIYASTTEYGGAAAIGAGSGGTNIAGNWGNIVINGGNITAIAKNYKKNSSTNSAIGGGWTKSLQASVSGGTISISNDAKVLAVGEHAGIGSGINNESGTLSIASTAELVAICLQEVATSRPIIADLASGATYPSLVHGKIAASSATDQVAYNDKIKILDVSGNIQNEFIVPSHVTTAGYFSAKTSAESNYILAENGAGSGDIKTVAKNKTPSDTSAYEYDSQNASYNVENYDYLYFVSEIPTLSAPTLSSSTLLYGRSISASIGNLQGVNSSDWSIDNNSIRWSEAGEEDLVRDIVDANAIEPNGIEEGGQTYIVCTVVVHDNTAGSPFPLAVEITSERASLTVERKPIYNIQISWSSQNFTCTRDANGNWSWSNPSQINVENHSNVPIIVNYRYEADHREGFYGVHGEFAQGNISLAKDNEDGQKSNTLTLFGRPFGLYIDEVHNLVGRSILSIVRDYGSS